MSTADDVLVPVQLSSPPGHILFFVFVLGFAGSSLVHLIRLYFKSGIGIEARNIVNASEDHTSFVYEMAERLMKITCSLTKFRIEQVGVNDDDCKKNEAFGFGFDREKMILDGKTNFWSRWIARLEASGAAFESNVGVFRYSQLEEAAGGACEYDCGSRDFYACDQCHHPKCWMNRSQKNRYLEVLLMVCAFLLSFANSGAFYFIQALSIVGIHDQFLKHSLAAFKWVFVASFFCNFLGVLVCLILQSRPEYHSYKKFTLIISNTTSFLLMVIGYGLLISFNMKV